MARFLLRRLVAMVIILLTLTAVMFVLHQANPGDPAKLLLGANASPEALRQLRSELWLDRPLILQYFHYLYQLVQGDLGVSVRTQRPVAQDLLRYIGPSLMLASLAILFAVGLSVVLGLLTARRARGSALVNTLLIGLASIPVFLFALILVIVFYAHWQVLPAGGQSSFFDAPVGPTHVALIDALIAGRPDVAVDAAQHLVLPVIALLVAPAVAIGRVYRNSLSGTMSAEYVRTARAKGLSETKVITHHALRNSLGPALSMTGLQIGGLFASLAVVEVIFAWPGLGAYVAASIPSGDFPGVAGVALVVGFIYIVANTVVDLLQAAADPRIRL